MLNIQDILRNMLCTGTQCQRQTDGLKNCKPGLANRELKTETIPTKTTYQEHRRLKKVKRFTTKKQHQFFLLDPRHKIFK